MPAGNRQTPVLLVGGRGDVTVSSHRYWPSHVDITPARGSHGHGTALFMNARHPSRSAHALATSLALLK